MASLCPKAEQYLLDHPEKDISRETRNKLATYDPDTQMKWLVNPLMQRMIENITNQILAGLQGGSLNANTTNTTNINTNSTNSTNNKPDNKPDPDPDEDEPLFGLFD